MKNEAKRKNKYWQKLTENPKISAKIHENQLLFCELCDIMKNVWEDSTMYVSDRPEKIESILFTEEQIKEKVAEIGKALTKEYDGKDPLFICILKGSTVFFADLIREVKCRLEIDFFRASSYSGTKTTGKVSANENDIPDIKGRNIVLVEDIIDTARTLSKLKEMFLRYEPESLKIVSLLDKPSRREVNLKGFKADLTGFEIEDLFVVGYGLDCDQQFRNLPYIGIYKP